VCVNAVCVAPSDPPDVDAGTGTVTTGTGGAPGSGGADPGTGGFVGAGGLTFGGAPGSGGAAPTPTDTDAGSSTSTGGWASYNPADGNGGGPGVDGAGVMNCTDGSSCIPAQCPGGQCSCNLPPNGNGSARCVYPG
jgi:hypothetical protein